MSRSSSGSGFFGLAALGCADCVDWAGWLDWLPAEELGPFVGQECWVDGEAGVCGAGCADCWPVWTVRTGSPACGRAEFVVPTPGRGSVGAGTGTVSSMGVDEGAAWDGADCWPGTECVGAPCWVGVG